MLGIDIDPRKVKELADEITETVVLDATDEDALRQVDIAAFQTVIVAIADDFEANALIASTLKKLGIPLIIAESNTHRHQEILLRIGVDRVILPKEESGYQLADELSIPGMLERLHLSRDYSLIEIKLPRGLIGKGVDACEPYEVIVLTVTTGQTRLENLKAITERVAGNDRRRFWYVTFDQLTPETALTEPIWQVAGQEGLQPLIW